MARRDAASANVQRVEGMRGALGELDAARERLEREGRREPGLRAALEAQRADDELRSRLARDMARAQARLEGLAHLAELEGNSAELERQLLVEERRLDEASRRVALAQKDRESLLARANEHPEAERQAFEADALKDAAQRDLAGAQGQIAAFEAARGQRTRVEALQGEISLQDGVVKRLEEGLKRLRSSVDAGRASIEAAGGNEEALRRLQVERDEAQGRLDELAVRHDRLTRLRATLDEAVREQDERDAAYRRTRCAWEASREASRRAQRAYLDHQAGILARGLQEGEACPVCGSLHHPRPASLSSDVPGEGALQALKDEEEGARTRALADAQAASAARRSCEGARGTLAEALADADEEALLVARDVAAKDVAAAEEGIVRVKAELARVKALREDLSSLEEDERKTAGELAEAQRVAQGLRQELHTAQGRLAALEGELPAEGQTACQERLDSCARLARKAEADARAARELAEGKSDALRRAHDLEPRVAELARLQRDAAELAQAARDRLTQARARRDEARAAVGPDTEQEVRQRLAALSEELEASRGRLEAAREAWEACRGSQASARATIQSLERTTRQARELDLARERKLMDEAEAKRGALDARLQDLGARQGANLDLLAKARQALADSSSLERRYGTLRQLADTLTGDLVGKEKLSFERYVQTVYFDQVITAANRRLAVVTGGRYQLLRRTDVGRGKNVGLDLDVLDNYTGKSRSARTLSGGESFEASLSLALGLSDVVQGRAGGVQLDTMFIDEGFGTLDADALQAAVKMLSDLSSAGKLVGIISHVAELQSVIERKVVVTSGREGSSARVVA
ncbi:AAA family ATPase [Olsenella massiliensis]|uniref:AAA family ATPase n=1 Tax=Olsenella massiliensis TaxID=1622075 RepID=UPI00071DD696|nr:SMC family ATPase [Olsenella massiliensis]